MRHILLQEGLGFPNFVEANIYVNVTCMHLEYLIMLLLRCGWKSLASNSTSKFLAFNVVNRSFTMLQ